MGSDLLGEKTCGEGETFTVQCAHGDVMTYPPLARVELRRSGRESSNDEGSTIRYTMTVSIAVDKCL